MESANVILYLYFVQIPALFCQNSVCENCCSNEIKLHETAELCLKEQWCERKSWNENSSDINSTEYEHASYVKLFPEGEFKVVKRCAIQNYEKLETIYGENEGIQVIDVGAFWNLPGLKNIYLAFNLLKEVQTGVFSDLPASVLDLSWNEIEFISESAFKGMTNLKSLNFSHNKLTEFDIFYTDIFINELILSYNFLSSINVRTDNNFTVLDVSFNNLKYFDIFYLTAHGKIDLTGNNIQQINWGGGKVDKLILSLNSLTDMSFLTGPKKDIKKVSLYPNPWKCDHLETHLKVMVTNNVTILDAQKDKRINYKLKSLPVCAVSSEKAYKLYEKIHKNLVVGDKIFCANDKACPHFMMCRRKQCWEPCQYNPCRNNKQCKSSGHRFNCNCPKGRIHDPLKLFSPCYIPCFTTEDCPIFSDTITRLCHSKNHVCKYVTKSKQPEDDY